MKNVHLRKQSWFALVVLVKFFCVSITHNDGILREFYHFETGKRLGLVRLHKIIYHLLAVEKRKS